MKLLTRYSSTTKRRLEYRVLKHRDPSHTARTNRKSICSQHSALWIDIKIPCECIDVCSHQRYRINYCTGLLRCNYGCGFLCVCTHVQCIQQLCSWTSSRVWALFRISLRSLIILKIEQREPLNCSCLHLVSRARPSHVKREGLGTSVYL